MIFVKEFRNMNSGIDQQMIEFIAERELKREDIIDIKYSTVISHMGNHYSYALLTYEKELSNG